MRGGGGGIRKRGRGEQRVDKEELNTKIWS